MTDTTGDNWTRDTAKLTNAEWAALTAIAAQVGAFATTGPTAGKPSWRRMLKDIANGELSVIRNAQPAEMIFVTLADKGYQIAIDLDEYQEHAELPEDFGIDSQSVLWYSNDYVIEHKEEFPSFSDLTVDFLQSWPSHIPHWVEPE